MAGAVTGRDTLSVKRATNRTTAANLTTREYFEKRLEGMKARRQDREPEIVEIASLAQPSRSRFVNAIATRGRNSSARMNKLYDGHAIRSFRYLTGGMYSGLSSPNRPWFRFVLTDKDLMKFHPVKVWLAECEKIIGNMLATSNFYSAAKLGYTEIGLFGTDACIMAESMDIETGNMRPVCFPQTFGEYWIACNSALEPDTLIRQCSMTVRQVVQSFVASKANPRDMDWSRVSPTVMNAWDNANYENEIVTYQGIEPNPDFVAGRADAAGKAWRSVKWELGQGDRRTLLEESGFASQPFWAPRWEITGTDDYGQGPGQDALPDMRSLQLQVKRKGETTDFVVKPPLIAPAGVKVKPFPGAITYAASVDAAQVKVMFETDYRAIGVIGEDAQSLRDAVDEATYARLFMMFSNMQGSADKTVPEIVNREEEKLTQLGPVIERVNTEKLQVAIDRAFDIATRNNMLPIPPEELQGMALQIDFVSILAQAQRMIGMTQTERAVGFVGSLEQLIPGCGAGDNVDTDALVADYWDRSGAQAQGLRSEEERDKIRSSRAQAAQAEKMAQMAPAMKQGAEGVQALAQTPVAGGDRTLFDSLIGAAPM